MYSHDVFLLTDKYSNATYDIVEKVIPRLAIIMFNVRIV